MTAMSGCRRPPLVSVVIPVYRSAGTLPELVRRLSEVFERLGIVYELVFVEDGSPDNSWDVLCRLRAEEPDRIVAVRLMRNFGQHNALMCGFRHARGDLVVTMDDDLQNPPEEIPKLLAAMEDSDIDLVYGVYERKQHRAWQNAGSAIVQAFHKWVFRTRVPISSFRIMRRELVESIFCYSLNFTFVDGLLAWNTTRIAGVQVEHHLRANGRSGYSLWKLVPHAINIFTNFSLLPLQLVSLAGFLAALGGFGAGAYYLAQYLFAQIAVPGYASTIIAILVLGGLQLLALGILGEYLGRVHLNINRKPQYTIRSVLTEPSHDDKGVSEAVSRSDPNVNITGKLPASGEVPVAQSPHDT